MDTHTNNNTPENGGNTPLTVDDAAVRISGLLDSLEGATHDENDVENASSEATPPEAEVIEGAEQTADADSDETIADDNGAESQEEAAQVLASDTSFVEMDGERISIAELKNGFLRHSDYTRKSQELAEQRKVYEANQTGIDTVRGEAIQALSTMRDNLVAQLQLEEVPDFDKLMANQKYDEFNEQQYKWQKRMNALAKIDAERQQLIAQTEERRRAIFAEESRKGQIELARLHPELASDNQVRGRFVEHLFRLGFTKDDLEGVTNPAIFSLAYDAMRYRESQAQKAQAVKTIEAKPKMVPTGSASPEPSPAKTLYDRDQARFRKDPNLDNAAAALKHLL